MKDPKQAVKVGRPPINPEKRRVNLGTSVKRETLERLHDIATELDMSLGQALDVIIGNAEAPE